jgi:hypothetical protein
VVAPGPDGPLDGLLHLGGYLRQNHLLLFLLLLLRIRYISQHIFLISNFEISLD